MPRVFWNQPLRTGIELVLTKTISHHLLNVLRLKLGEQLILFNGQGGEFTGRLVNIKNKLAIIILESYSNVTTESTLKINLAQAIVSSEKMDFIIQKAVELGVSKITPLFTEHSNIKISQERLNKKIQHWHNIIISSCEQSGRNHIPELSLPQNISTWLSSPLCGNKFILSPQFSEKISADIKVSEINVVIGPEGGLSKNEIKLAQQHNFIPIKLGPRIMRTETASIAALSFFETLFGDFGRYTI